MKKRDEELDGEWAQHSALSIIKETYPIGPVHYPRCPETRDEEACFNAASLAALSAAGEQSREHPEDKGGIYHL